MQTPSQQRQWLHLSQRAILCVSIMLFIVCFAYLIALMIQWYANPLHAGTPCSNEHTEDAIACPPFAEGANECVAGLLNVNGQSCAYLPRARTVACTNSCYVADSNTTYCDGFGHCVGDSSECKGQCTNSVTVFDDFLNNDLIFSYDVDSYWAWVWYNPTPCFFGRAVASIVDVAVGSTEEAIFHNASQPRTIMPVGLRNRCSDYLSPAFYAEQGDCLAITRAMLPTSMVNHFNFDDYENGTVPLQLSVCMFYYQCSIIDPELFPIESDSSSAKRGMGRAVRQSPLHWGLTPVTSGDDDTQQQPLSAVVNSAPPSRRAQFWEQLLDMTATTLKNTPHDKKQKLAEELKKRRSLHSSAL